MNEVRKSLHHLVEENEDENSFYSPDVIEHLETKYMPYCFLWASFTLKNLSEHITRFTNGTLEKKFGTRKSRSKTFLKLNPSQYAIDSEKYSCGLAIQFLNHEKIKNDQTNTLSSESDDMDGFEDEDYQDANHALESWNKKQENKAGGYQKKRSVNFRKYLSENETTKQTKLKNDMDFDDNILDNIELISKPKSILKSKKSLKAIKCKKESMNEIGKFCMNISKFSIIYADIP